MVPQLVISMEVEGLGKEIQSLLTCLLWLWKCSQLFAKAVRNKAIDFHHRCWKLQLSQLCFANDLLTSSTATMTSVQAIKMCWQSLQIYQV